MKAEEITIKILVILCILVLFIALPLKMSMDADKKHTKKLEEGFRYLVYTTTGSSGRYALTNEVINGCIDTYNNIRICDIGYITRIKNKE